MTAVFALHLVPGLDAVGPMVFEDEIGYLMAARSLAGQTDGVLIGPMGSYSIGWSLPLVPLALMIEDPNTFYRAAVVLGAAASAFTVLPLSWFTERISRLDRTRSQLVAGATMCMPGLTLMSGYAYAEGWFVLVYVLTGVTCIRWFDVPTIGRAVVFASAANLAFLTHGRGAGVVLATMTAFALSLMSGPRRRAAIAGLATSGVGVVLVGRAQTAIEESIYVLGFDRTSRIIDQVTTAPVSAHVASLAGQSFYAGAATLGLGAIGAAVALWKTWDELLRRRSVGAHSWVAGSSLAVLLLSALPFGSVIGLGVPRLDSFGYGRYVDGIVVLLAVIGLGALATPPTRREGALWATTGAVLTAAGLATLTAIVGVDALSGKPIAALSIGGLAPYMGDGFQHYPTVGPLLATVGFLVVITLMRSETGKILVTASTFCALSIWGEATTMRPLDGPWQQLLTLEDDVSEIEPSSLWIDDRSDHLYARNGYQFALGDRPVGFFVDLADVPANALIVATRQWTEGEQAGARRVGAELRLDQALWVLPGEFQRELEASGRLELSPDQPLPQSARSAEIDPSVDRVRLGQEPTLLETSVALTHTGAGAPWPALGSLSSPPGAVRLWVRWETDDGVWAATQIIELPETVYPQQQIVIDGTLDVPAAVADAPITRLRFSLLHEGHGDLLNTEVVVPVAQS